MVGLTDRGDYRLVLASSLWRISLLVGVDGRSGRKSPGLVEVSSHSVFLRSASCGEHFHCLAKSLASQRPRSMTRTCEDSEDMRGSRLSQSGHRRWKLPSLQRITRSVSQLHLAQINMARIISQWGLHYIGNGAILIG
jgi:hypothetical protein